MYEVATQHVLEPVDDFIEAAARQVMTIHCSPDSPGDILVFMPGQSMPRIRVKSSLISLQALRRLRTV